MRNLPIHRPKKGFFKIFLLIFSALILFLFLGFTFLNLFFADKLKKSTEDYLSHRLEQDVLIQDLKFSILKGVTLKKVIVQERTRNSETEDTNGTLLLLQSASLFYSPLNLLKSELKLKISIKNLDVFLSHGTNNFLPYYKSQYNKLNQSPGKSNLKINFDFLDAQNVIVHNKDSNYKIDFMSLESFESQKKKLGLSFSYNKLFKIKGDVLLEKSLACVNFDYTIEAPSYSKYLSEGHVWGIVTNWNGFVLTNQAQGDFGHLFNVIHVKPFEQKISFNPTNNFFVRQKKKIFLSGQIENFKQPLIRLFFKSPNLSLESFSKTFQGDLKLLLNVEFFNKLNISGLVSSDLISYKPMKIMIKKVYLPIRKNRVLKGFFELEQGRNKIACKIVNTGNLLEKKKKINLSLKGDYLNLEDFSFGSSTNKSKTPNPNLNFAISGDAFFREIQYKNNSLFNLSGIFALKPGDYVFNISKLDYKLARVSAKVRYKNDQINFNGKLKKFNLNSFFTELRSDFSGSFQGYYDVSKKEIKANGLWSTSILKYGKFTIHNYSVPWQIEKNNVVFTNAVGELYSGTLMTYGFFDLQKQFLQVQVKGTDLSAKDLFREYIKDENQKISGLLGLSSSVEYDVNKKDLNIKTDMNLQKGIIKNTDIQKKIGNLLSSDTINYIFYNSVKTAVQITQNKIYIKKFDLKANDIELDLSGTYNFETKQRNVAMNFLLSDNFVKNLPNIYHLPLTAVSKKAHKWYSLVAKENNNKIVFEKK